MPPDASPASAGHVEIDAAHPWPGLAAYDEAAAEFFHGREEESAQLLLLIRLAPLTALYGKSGLGKSSLLQAGLFPRLRADHGLPVYLRLDFSAKATEQVMDQIARRLAEEVAAAGAECPPRVAGESLWEYLHRVDVEIWSSDNYLLTPILVFDQFEELFSHEGGDADRLRSVIDDLTDLFENRIPAALADADAKPRRSHLDLLTQRYRMVLSFREDYLADLKTLEPKVPSLLRNYLRLEAMTRAHATEVVERAGAEVVSPGVAPLMIDFIEGRVEGRADPRSPMAVIEPVLLSLFCYQLNRRRNGTMIDGPLVRKAGQDILDGFYRDALADKDVTGPPEVWFFIEDYLVQGGRFRGSYPRIGAVEGGLITEKQLEALTNRQRLLRVVQYADTARIELIHDCLVPVVRKTRDERLVKKRQEELHARQVELERQVREKEANNRQLIRWRNLLIVALVLALTTLGFAACQRHRATLAAQRAMAFAAIGGTYQAMTRGPEVSMLLGLQAMALARSSGDAKASERADGILRRLLNQRVLFDRQLPGKVHGLAFSPDGQALAVADDTHVRIVDAQSGADGSVPAMESSGEIRRVLFTADGTRLVSGDANGEIRVWDPRTGAETTPKPMHQGAAISALALDPTGVLASASLRDGRILLWDLRSGDSLGPVPDGGTPERWVSGLAFDRNGTHLAVSEVHLGATTIWDVSRSATDGAPQLRPRFTLHNRKPNGDDVGTSIRMLTETVAFSPDGHALATGDRYNAVNVWAADSGTHLRGLLGHTDQVRKVAFSPDGTRLASAGADGTVNIWDVASGRSILLLTGQSQPIEDLALSPDGTRLATAGEDRHVRVWNVATHGDALFAVAFSPDGTRLATGSGDSTIKIWDTATRRLVKELKGHDDRVVSLAFSPDGQFLASAAYDKTTRIWNVDSGTLATPPCHHADKRFGEDKFNRVTYSRDGRWLATAGANNVAVLWDAKTGTPVFEGHHDGQVSGVAFSRDGTQLASVGHDRKLRLWRVPDGSPIATIDVTEQKSLLEDVDFDPTGERVVMALGTAKVLLMSIASHDIQELESSKGVPISRAKFTGDGKHLLLLGPQPDVEIMDIDAAGPPRSRVFAVNNSKVNDVAVADGPNGTWIATASQDGNFTVSPFASDQLEAAACSRLQRKTLTKAECERFLGTTTCPQPPPCQR